MENQHPKKHLNLEKKIAKAFKFLAEPIAIPF